MQSQGSIRTLRQLAARVLLGLLSLLPGISPAFELHQGAHHSLSLEVDVAYSGYHSERSYAQTTISAGSRSWTEGYTEFILRGRHDAWGDSEWYGTISNLTTATWGDGDATGITTGQEQRTDLEDAYLGWQSGTLWPALGKDGVEFYFGRRNFMLGDGFLIDGDTSNFGKGFDDQAVAGLAPGTLNRGGAYWLGPRQAFDRIALAQVGADTTFNGKLFWIESNNKAQARTKIAGVDLGYQSQRFGDFALAYIRRLDVDNVWAEYLGLSQRDGQDTLNLRWDGSTLLDPMTLKGEIVRQDNGSSGDDWAWYGAVAWKFADLYGKPQLGFRYSAFSEGYDTIFYGFSTGYGTWFQGEVAGNYAGPFNTNAAIIHLHARIYPNERWTVGALFFSFDTDEKDQGDLDGVEMDLFFSWEVNDHITVSPLLGLYKPDRDAADGGSQLGNDDLNVYAQVVVTLEF